MGVALRRPNEKGGFEEALTRRAGVNICPKMGKPFPNADFQNHKLFPKYNG